MSSYKVLVPFFILGELKLELISLKLVKSHLTPNGLLFEIKNILLCKWTIFAEFMKWFLGFREYIRFDQTEGSLLVLGFHGDKQTKRCNILMRLETARLEYMGRSLCKVKRATSGCSCG